MPRKGQVEVRGTTRYHWDGHSWGRLVEPHRVKLTKTPNGDVLLDGKTREQFRADAKRPLPRD